MTMSSMLNHRIGNFNAPVRATAGGYGVGAEVNVLMRTVKRARSGRRVRSPRAAVVARACLRSVTART